VSDHWKVHALPNGVSEADQERRYVVVLEQPDPRGFGWRRQIRGFAETTKEPEGLLVEEARAIARALNAMIRKAEHVSV
jgi:hypothetical protein